MQFEEGPPGTRVPLPRPSIDTGMGLERLAAILQGKHDNYDIDMLRALILASRRGHRAGPGRPAQGVSHRVIADHLRSVAFLIADGVLPSNEGRGYVLRRIMRRAMRHATMMGAQEPVMYRLVPALIRQMGAAYPELVRAEAADRRDAAAGGDPLQDTCWSAGWVCWPRRLRGWGTASRCRARWRSGCTTRSASRWT